MAHLAGCDTAVIPGLCAVTVMLTLAGKLFVERLRAHASDIPGSNGAHVQRRRYYVKDDTCAT
jgi:hypothetical protein